MPFVLDSTKRGFINKNSTMSQSRLLLVVLHSILFRFFVRKVFVTALLSFISSSGNYDFIVIMPPTRLFFFILNVNFIYASK